MTEKEPSNEIKINWVYCPLCGSKIPKADNIRYCIKCGVDLHYIKTHMRLPHKSENEPSINTIAAFEQQQYPKYFPISLKYSDEDLLNLQDKKLWSTSASLGMTIAAFILMNVIAVFIAILFVIFTFNLENAIEIFLSPYFIIISSFIEIVLIIVPVMYVGKYLQRPNIKNRLQILGFTAVGFSKNKILKEILIGIAFAIIGIILVYSVSFIMEFFMYSIFGAETIQNAVGSTSDVDLIITSSDYLSLTLLVLIMIFIIGTSEEILFRGFLQKGLVRNLGKKWGIFITAFIFSIIHLIGIFLVPLPPIAFLVSFILNFFPFFAISLLLGLLYDWRKENLIAVMITHGVYDALTLIIVFILYTMF